MSRYRVGLGFALTLFLFVFLLCPLAGLLFAAILGEQAPVLNWLTPGGFLDALGLLSEKATLDYYREFFSTPRYYRGFFNAVGLGPVVVTTLFFLGWLGQSLVPQQKRLWAWLRGPGLIVTFALVCLASATRPLWAHPQGMWARVLDGTTVGVRLLQACGYCPLVTLAGSVIGVGVALCLHFTNLPLKKIFSLLVIVPLSMPPFLGALAFKNLLGDFGMVTRLFHLIGLSHPFSGQSALSAGLVESFLFFPFVTMTTLSALERFDTSLP